MADELPNPMAESGVTMHSDSELYNAEDVQLAGAGVDEVSDNHPIILYQAPTIWSIFRGASINLFLPFVNGMMMGFGELFAHEWAFRLGWSETKVFPLSRRAGPGVEVREKR